MTEKPDSLIPTRWTLISRLKNWDDEKIPAGTVAKTLGVNAAQV